ncbi:unnamed protein product [Sphagnum tenellum]
MEEASDVVEHPRWSRWSGERIARLGFLVGCGWDAARIGADPLIGSTAKNVHRQVQRFGLSFRVADKISIKPKVVEDIEPIAGELGMSPEALVNRLMMHIIKDNLVKAILDGE